MGDFTTVGLDVVAAKFLEREEETTKAVNKMLEVGAEVLVKAQQEEAAAMGIKETAGFIFLRPIRLLARVIFTFMSDLLSGRC